MINIQNTKNILVLGSDGTMGSYLLQYLQKKFNLNVFGTTRKIENVAKKILYVDLLDNSTFTKLQKYKFDVVIFCAAICDLLICERDPFLTRKVNVENTLSIARVFSQNNSKIIYPSTSRVFDGLNPNAGIYTKINPQTQYGIQKAECEKLLLKNISNVQIIRLTELIYPSHPLLNKWITDYKKGIEIEPFYDLSISPLSLILVLETIYKLIYLNFDTTIQLSSNYDISYAQAVEYIFKKLNFDKSLIKSKSCKNLLGFKKHKYSSMKVNLPNSMKLNAPEPFEAIDYFIQGLYA